jgi:hypothetical protein
MNPASSTMATISPLSASPLSWFSIRCAHVVIVFVARTESIDTANNQDYQNNPTT